MDLHDYLYEGETVANYATVDSPIFNTGVVPYQMIVDSDTPIDRQDLGACLEETLHRLLEADAPDNEIAAITGMKQFHEVDEEMESTSIDLGYVLPVEILWIEKEESSLDEILADAEEKANHQETFDKEEISKNDLEF